MDRYITGDMIKRIKSEGQDEKQDRKNTRIQESVVELAIAVGV